MTGLNKCLVAKGDEGSGAQLTRSPTIDIRIEGVEGGGRRILRGTVDWRLRFQKKFPFPLFIFYGLISSPHKYFISIYKFCFDEIVESCLMLQWLLWCLEECGKEEVIT